MRGFIFKEKGERKRRKKNGDMGKAFRSTTMTVFLNSGAIDSRCQVDNFEGGKSVDISVDLVFRMRL